MDELRYKKEYFDCDCHSLEDIFRLEYWDIEDKSNIDDDIIYLSTFVFQDRTKIFPPISLFFFKKDWKKYFNSFYQSSIWERIFFSIKHVFGLQNNKSIFNSVIIRDIDIDRLGIFLSHLIAQENIYNQYIEESIDSYELKNNKCRLNFAIDEIAQDCHKIVISYKFRTRSGFFKRLTESIRYLIKRHYKSMDFEITALDAAFLRLIIKKYKEKYK